jgi:hypothetical protein
MDPVMIRPPGIGAFVVSPETVWYARVLLLFSASAMIIDTGSESKSFDCALVSTLKTYDDPEKMVITLYYTYYCNYCEYVH